MILYFLPAIILLGILTSEEDIKCGKIRNRHILFALLYALIVNLALIAYFYSNEALNMGYVLDLTVNFLIAVIVAFGVWNFRLWSAGDAKLFIAYSALLPLTAYSYGYIKYFPSLLIIINTVVPYFIYSLFKAFFSTSAKEKKAIIKTLTFRRLVSMLLSFFGIHWAVSLLKGLVNINFQFMDYLLVFIIYYLLEKALGRKSEKKMIYAAIIISILRIVFDRSVLDYAFWYNFIGYTFLFMLFRYAVIDLASRSAKKEVYIEELKPGMLLSEGIKREGKGDNMKFAKTEDMKKNFFELGKEGLTEDEIKKIKRERQRFTFSKIKIYETMPFAPIIFLGVVLTILSKGNFFIIAVKFINMLGF